ncbi:MAG: DUF2064 domain-containing protein [Blastocatellia bacterium]|nr:DUF2064 domain-containing protein [Blastocatellia bacterium]
MTVESAVPPNQTQKKALLVFATALELDLVQRKFPKAFRPLLAACSFDQNHLPEADVHLFTTPGFIPDRLGSKVNHHYQKGNSFGECLEQAVETLAGLGYGKIVIIGRDCPDLELSDIQEAFAALDSHRLVLGPDHRGGCYLIALQAADRGCLHHIRWRQNTDCRELQERFALGETRLLTVKIDLDTVADVHLLARSGSRWQPLAVFLLTVIAFYFTGFQTLWSNLSRRQERARWQLPPPSLASANRT